MVDVCCFDVDRYDCNSTWDGSTFACMLWSGRPCSLYKQSVLGKGFAFGGKAVTSTNNHWLRIFYLFQFALPMKDTQIKIYRDEKSVPLKQCDTRYYTRLYVCTI